MLRGAQLLPQLIQLLVEGPFGLIFAHLRLKGRNRRVELVGLLRLLGGLTGLLGVRQKRLLSTLDIQTALIFFFCLLIVCDDGPEGFRSLCFFIAATFCRDFLFPEPQFFQPPLGRMKGLKPFCQLNVRVQLPLFFRGVKGRVGSFVFFLFGFPFFNAAFQLGKRAQPLFRKRQQNRFLLLIQSGFPLIGSGEESLRVAVPAFRVKDFFQNILLFRGGGGQEALKLSLGEQHHLTKLLLRQAHQFDRFICQVIFPGVFKEGDQHAGFVKLTGGVLRRQILPLGLQAADKLIFSALYREGEADLRCHVLACLIAAPFLQVVPANSAFAVIPAAAAVERKGHGIENGGLAAAGGPFDQKHALL